MSLSAPKDIPEERLWLLALALRPWCGPRRVRFILDHWGTPEAFFAASPRDREALGLPRALWKQPSPKEALAKALAEVEALKRLGAGFLTWDDEDYPAALRNLPDPPPVLFFKGNLRLKPPILAVVGSRAATSYGLRVTRSWGRELVRAGVSVVSGLAVGIDTAAHQACLEAGGFTVAVLGTGLDRVYPRENTTLAREIAQKGLILTEFPLGTKPRPQNFPIRNRLISGLAQAVLVVEASPRSGSLITARLAGEQGKEVLAVPGPVHAFRSHGCHQLIRQGALLVDRPEQVLESLGLSHLVFAGETQKDEAKRLTLSPEETKVWEALDLSPLHLDEVVRRAGLAVSQVSGILVALELKGLVASSPGNFFQKVVDL